MTSIPIKLGDRSRANYIASVIVSLFFVFISTVLGLALDRVLRTSALFTSILSVTAVLQVLFGLSVVSYVIAKILQGQPIAQAKIPDRQKETLEKILLEAKEAFNYMYDVRLFIIPHYSINALSVGIHKHEHLILVTLGAVEKLSDNQLRGLIYHEMFHIKHGDTDYLTCLSGTFGAPFLVYTLALESLRNVRKRMKKRNDEVHKKLVSRMLLSILVLALTTLMKPVGLLSNLFVNPKKDLEVDLQVASMVGIQHYTAILERILSDCVPLTQNYFFIRHLFFSHPNCKDLRKKKLNNLISAYPSIQERIDSVRLLERKEGSEGN